MTEFKFTHQWQTIGNDAPEYRHTMAELSLHVGKINLMKNEDIWYKTIRETALMSAYPLAIWLAYSWWRLNWEPLPVVQPSVDWRMAHELGAADHGFVWPQIIFASDREEMKVWAVPSRDNDNQSVRYLNGLDMPASIPLDDFRRGMEDFIDAVLNRLDATGCRNTDLSNLWQLIQEDQGDQKSAKYRRLEAEMGYDPDECSEELINKALVFENQIGAAALSELAPIYGKSARQSLITAISEIDQLPGLLGKPDIPSCNRTVQGLPWQRAVSAARELRQAIGKQRDKIDNSNLCGLLGIRVSEFEQWQTVRRNAAIAVPVSDGQFRFIPRRKHETTNRFQLARFIGDYIFTEHINSEWLTSTDLKTSRQKYQKAFAAEFLCPIDKLKSFLDDDYSESAIEDAAEHFQVSSRAISSLLVNNRMISFLYPEDYSDSGLPYRIAA